jgi:glutamate--cysteine ligase
VDPGWCPVRPSKPLGWRSASPGGFDSHALPPSCRLLILPLTPSDLRSALTRGFRPQNEWALGLEFEQFVTRMDGTPLPYESRGETQSNIGVEDLLERLAVKSGWARMTESGRLMGLKAKDGRQVTLEPGAQLEFGSTPCRSLRELEAEVEQYCLWLRELSRECGVRFLALGAQPTAHPSEIERIPKSRYDILEPWLEQAGDLGLWMMKTTCGVQVNFDHSDEADAMRKLVAVYRLSPLFTAMFAHSSVAAGELTGFASWRGHVWSRTDPSRCGLVEALCRPGATIDDYVEWVLDVPMLFVERDGRYVDCRGQTFREYLGRGQATMADWELHLSTPFPEARLRPQVELRCADSNGPLMSLALAALVKGVFYHDEALAQAEALVADWSFERLTEAWHDSHRYGLNGPRPLLPLARQLVGLAQLDDAEADYLQPLQELLASGMSQAEQTIARYQPGGEWATGAESIDLRPLVRLKGCPFAEDEPLLP